MQQLKLIGHGRTAEVFDYGEGRILKLFNRGLSPDLSTEEYSISKLVYELGIPSPKPFEMIHIDDRIGIVYQRVSGLTILKCISSNPLMVVRESVRLAELHSNINEVVVDSGILKKQKDKIRNKIQVARLLTDEEKGKIIRYLEDLPEDNKLCHGDYHPDNVLIHDKGYIIDWMTGTSGNPAGDAARTILILKMGTMPEGTPKVILFGAHFIREIILKIYIKHYTRYTGIDYKKIEEWMLPVAAARLADGVPEEEKRKLLQYIKSKI